jgi:hypothetical protein
MRTKTTTTVELDIGELMALIEYNKKMADSIHPDSYDDMSMAGHTFGETVVRYRKRATELFGILSEVWPQ